MSEIDPQSVSETYRVIARHLLDNGIQSRMVSYCHPYEVIAWDDDDLRYDDPRLHVHEKISGTVFAKQHGEATVLLTIALTPG